MIQLIDESRHHEAIGQEVAAPDPGPATLRSEPEVEQGPATPVYAPTTKNEMPPAAAPAQSIATGARRGGRHRPSVRLILGLGVLVLLCLWGVVFFGLDTWGVTDASINGL